MTETKTRRKPAQKQVKKPKIDLEFAVDRAPLLAALTAVMRTVPTGGMMPALTGVLLEQKANKLTIRGTDLELSISTIVEVDGPLAGKALVPGKLFTDVIRAAGPKIRVRVSEQVCVVEAEDYHADLLTFDPGDFPAFSKVEGPTRKVEAAPLMSAVNRSLVAASTDTGRPILCGVYIDDEGGKMQFVGTDSYRLAVVPTNLDALDRPIIVPQRSLAAFARTVPHDVSHVSIRLGANAVAFDFGGTSVVTRIIDGQYPAYRNLIPHGKQTIEIAVDRKTIVDSVAKLKPLLNGDKPLRLAFTPKTCTLTVKAQDEGDGEDKIAAEMEGARTFSIAVNDQYFVDGINSFGTDGVTISCNDQLKPMVIRGTGDTTGLYLLMPTRIPT